MNWFEQNLDCYVYGVAFVICNLQIAFASVVRDLSSIMLETGVFLGKIFFVVLKIC
jgi:hypothetical protein